MIIAGVGNLTRDPEVRFTSNGNAVANFTAADSRKFGEKEEVFFGDCEAWGKLAEICGQYLKKGSKVFIVGRPKTDTWEKDGEKKSRVKIVVTEVKFLSGKQQAGEEVDEGSIPF